MVFERSTGGKVRGSGSTRRGSSSSASSELCQIEKKNLPTSGVRVGENAKYACARGMKSKTHLSIGRDLSGGGRSKYVGPHHEAFSGSIRRATAPTTYPSRSKRCR